VGETRSVYTILDVETLVKRLLGTTRCGDKIKIKLSLGELCLEDGLQVESCARSDFVISGVEPSGSTTSWFGQFIR
jgi:hypothetical protein